MATVLGDFDLLLLRTPQSLLILWLKGRNMTFKVGDLVGIVPVRDTGAVSAANQPSVDRHDVLRTQLRVVENFAVDELFLLTEKRRRITQRIETRPGFGFLFKSTYHLWKHRPKVSTTVHYIKDGHVGPRMPR